MRQQSKKKQIIDWISRYKNTLSNSRHVYTNCQSLNCDHICQLNNVYAWKMASFPAWSLYIVYAWKMTTFPAWSPLVGVYMYELANTTQLIYINFTT